jgi:hypothetical protein
LLGSYAAVRDHLGPNRDQPARKEAVEQGSRRSPRTTARFIHHWVPVSSTTG